MKYCFFLRDFHSLPIADRLKDDGAEVVVGMVQDEDNESTPEGKSDARLALYDGIIEKHDADDVLKWMASIKDKDEWWVNCDYGDLWPYAEKALEMGFRVGLFPTEEGYKLEEDRKFGKEFARKHYPDLKVAEAHEFKKADEAIAFIEENTDKIFVLKSEGSNAETVVPQTDDPELAARQVIGALQSERADYEKTGMTLEERIRNPVEISPVMMFWNGKPLYSVVEIENKPLGAGNIGRLTGGCQNLTIQTPLDCPLNRIAFPPIVYEMAKKQVGLGIYDAGLLFDGHNFQFTEFCATRYGFDGFYSQVAMSGDERGKGCALNHFEGLAAARNPLRWNYGVAVRLFQSEPGDEPGTYAAGYAIDWLNQISDQLFLYCIERKKLEGSDKSIFVSNAYEKEVGTCTGVGVTPDEAVASAYRCADGVAMTGLFYRPKQDFLSKAYFTSIPNRLEFLLKSGLIS